MPGVSGALASAQHWWMPNGPWFDLRSASLPLYDRGMTGHEWAQLGVSAVFWLIIPLAIGLRALMRSEVK